jgi:hypothetical protein
MLGLTAVALGKSKLIDDIDQYCIRVQTETSGSPPLVFSGPEPWVELDEAPAYDDDDVIALVYTSGPAVRWVLLRIANVDERWAEDVAYYFRDDGTIAKRQRHVQAPGANVELDAVTYYEHGDVIKERVHHHALGHGRKHLSDFNDPDAPVYMRVEDLPFPDATALWRRLA